MAGKISYIAPVDTVSGAFGTQKESFSGKCIISNVRKAASQAHPRGHMYFSVLTKTTYKATSGVVAWNNTFKQICAATRQRLKDPSQITQDQIAFAAQDKYKTLYAYVWNSERDKIEG